MVVEEIANVTAIPGLEGVSTLITVFQAIGGLIIAYIIFNILNTVWNRKKRNELRKIRESVERIERALIKKNKTKG